THKRRIECAEGLLAHTTMANMSAIGFLAEAIAYGAALAAAGPGLSHVRPAVVASLRYRDRDAGWSGCRRENRATRHWLRRGPARRSTRQRRAACRRG